MAKKKPVKGTITMRLVPAGKLSERIRRGFGITDKATLVEVYEYHRYE